MITNASITLYHKIKGRAGETYERYNFANVWAFGGHGAALNKGLADMNNLSVRIPYKQNEVDISKIDIGDLIVIGTLDTDIQVESDLDDYYILTSITDNKENFLLEPHVHLGAK